MYRSQCSDTINSYLKLLFFMTCTFQLTWADFVLVAIVETIDLRLHVEIEKNYPSVQTLIKKIRNLPGVKEYIAKNPPYKF